MDVRQYSFERLKVWENIRLLIRRVYEISSGFPEHEKFGLINQMRRAAVSIASNLAEGTSRTSTNDQAYFYQIAYSSLMEALSQVIVSFDLNYLDSEKYSELRALIQSISAQLNALRKSTLSR